MDKKYIFIVLSLVIIIGFGFFVWQYLGAPEEKTGITKTFRSCGDAFVDPRDGKIYATALIGSQCWMTESMNVGVITAGVNEQGSDCPSVSEIEKYCYNDTELNCTSDGALYQWAQATCGGTSCNGLDETQLACTSPVQGICPEGWHIPSPYEWIALLRVFCNSGNCATDFPYNVYQSEGWRGTIEGMGLKGSGSSGFKVLMAGARDIRAVKTFRDRGEVANIWSSLGKMSGSNAWEILLSRLTSKVGIGSTYDGFGSSVRCIKD